MLEELFFYLGKKYPLGLVSEASVIMLVSAKLYKMKCLLLFLAMSVNVLTNASSASETGCESLLTRYLNIALNADIRDWSKLSDPVFQKRELLERNSEQWGYLYSGVVNPSNRYFKELSIHDIEQVVVLSQQGNFHLGFAKKNTQEFIVLGSKKSLYKTVLNPAEVKWMQKAGDKDYFQQIDKFFSEEDAALLKKIRGQGDLGDRSFYESLNKKKLDQKDQIEKILSENNLDIPFADEVTNDQKYILSRTKGTFRIWNVAGKKIDFEVPYNDLGIDTAFLNEGGTKIFIYNNGTEYVFIYDIASRKLEHVFLLRYEYSPCASPFLNKIRSSKKVRNKP